MSSLKACIEYWSKNNISAAKNKLCKALAFFNKKTFETYYFQDDYILALEEKNFLDDVLIRLKKGEPFTKVLGLTAFYGRDFYVNQHVLDPRVDTECLINAVLKYNKKSNFEHGLDLGTGSGCISITLLLEIEDIEFLAIDASKDALNIAQKNCKKFKLEERLKLKYSHWFEDVDEYSFDCIVSNPPYVEDHYPLEGAVKNYDPHTALFSGKDGLDDYKIILNQLDRYLKAGGFFFGEIGFNQKEAIENLVDQYQNLHFVECLQDLEDRDRVVVIQRK